MKFSIQIKIICSVIAFLLIPLLLVYGISYKTIEKIIIEKTKQYTIAMLLETDQKIENMVNNLGNISEIICNDSAVISSLKSQNDEKDFEKLVKIQRIEEIVRNVRNTQLNYKYHYNIFILTDQTQFVGSCYNKDGSYLSKDEFASVVDMKNSDWYKDLKELKYGVRWTTPKKDTIDLSQKSYVSLSRVIVDPVTFKFMGVLIVSISLDNLSEIIQSEYVDDGRTTYVFDENGLALFSDAQDFDNNRAHMLYNITVQPSFHQSTIEEIEHQSILVASDTNLKNGWKVVYEVPLDYIFLEIYDTRKKHLLTIGCLVLFFTASLLLMIHKIMKPMRNFKSAMEKISDGDFDIQVKVDSFDEFSSLAQTLNMMAVKVKDLVCQIEEKRKKEQQLKFAVLHAQINPHFLFNSLNTIKLSAELSQAYNISKMITELGKLLKYSINIQMDTTSIQAEVEYLESYIYLYNIRYSNGIKLITEVDECLFDKKIPKMILQPLVENAIIHGFNNSGFGTIKVCINSIQQQIVITVSDDGKGIPQFTIMALQQMREISETSERNYTRVGLKNVQERLQLRYGETMRFSVESTLEQGTSIVIAIPAEEENKINGPT